jgi:hypothetical protein
MTIIASQEGMWYKYVEKWDEFESEHEITLFYIQQASSHKRMIQAKTIIFGSRHILFYRFLTLRGEHRLTALENRVLRTIFGPKRNKIIRG